MKLTELDVWRKMFKASWYGFDPKEANLKTKLPLAPFSFDWDPGRDYESFIFSFFWMQNLICWLEVGMILEEKRWSLDNSVTLYTTKVKTLVWNYLLKGTNISVKSLKGAGFGNQKGDETFFFPLQYSPDGLNIYSIRTLCEVGSDPCHWQQPWMGQQFSSYR